MCAPGRAHLLGGESPQSSPHQENAACLILRGLRICQEGCVDGYIGGWVSADSFIHIAMTSASTAARDLKDSVEKGVLIRTGELKHTRYHLNVPVLQPLDWNWIKTWRIGLDPFSYS